MEEVGGSNPGHSVYFFATLRRFNYETRREDNECDRSTTRRPVKARKAGAAKKEDGETGRRRRNGYENGVPFISKMIKWLTPSRGLTWREKLINVLLPLHS